MKVTLTAVHTHGGSLCAPGDQIDVSQVEYDWLAERELIAAAAHTKTSAGYAADAAPIYSEEDPQ